MDDNLNVGGRNIIALLSQTLAGRTEENHNKLRIVYVLIETRTKHLPNTSLTSNFSMVSRWYI
jgi:hypothetical protein